MHNSPNIWSKILLFGHLKGRHSVNQRHCPNSREQGLTHPHPASFTGEAPSPTSILQPPGIHIIILGLSPNININTLTFFSSSSHFPLLSSLPTHNNDKYCKNQGQKYCHNRNDNYHPDFHRIICWLKRNIWLPPRALTNHKYVTTYESIQTSQKLGNNYLGKIIASPAVVAQLALLLALLLNSQTPACPRTTFPSSHLANHLNKIIPLKILEFEVVCGKDKQICEALFITINLTMPWWR